MLNRNQIRSYKNYDYCYNFIAIVKTQLSLRQHIQFNIQLAKFSTITKLYAICKVYSGRIQLPYGHSPQTPLTLYK